jgi:catalase
MKNAQKFIRERAVGNFKQADADYGAAIEKYLKEFGAK